jgi:hypothetical protein
VEAYDIASNTWSTVAPYPDSVGWLMSTSIGGFIYAAGGISSTESLKTYRYDPAGNSWNDAAIADLPSTRWSSASDILKGKWVLAGGYSGNIVQNTALQWDPVGNIWSAIDRLPAVRSRMSGATANGVEFYAVGGRDASGGFNGNNNTYKYKTYGLCQPTFTPSLTPTGPATNTRTATRTFTSTRTSTPTATIVPCGAGSNYLITQSTGSITPGVTRVDGTGCDDCLTTIALPFGFNLYDRTFTSVQASSNGQLDFLLGDASYDNTCLPDTLASYAIFPHWDDMTTEANVGCSGHSGGSCGIYTTVAGTAPNRVFIIEWRAVYYDETTLPVSLEVLLYEAPNAGGARPFEVIYGVGADRGANATVGVQKGTGSVFTQYSCNVAVLNSGLKLRFEAPPCVPTATPTPLGVNLVGHVTWHNVPLGPRSVQPITLSLKLGTTETNYPAQNTDASGFFTVNVAGLPNGTYDWRVMGPDGQDPPPGTNTRAGSLANCGTVALTGSDTSMNNDVVFSPACPAGCIRGGDANNSNNVNAQDFNIIKLQFGQPPSTYTGDANNDTVVNSQDFNIMKANFGQAGCSAVLSPGAGKDAKGDSNTNK